MRAAAATLSRMNLNKIHTAVALALATTGAAVAQVPLAIPHLRSHDLLVVDSDYDGVWRLADGNQDGDYNDPGEITSFYSDAIGAYAWTTPACIGSAPNGTVHVGDSGTDTIYALLDGNGDGDANDAGEHRIFFDASNAGGFAIPTPNGITFDAIGRMFLTIINSASPAVPDRILVLEDLNSDGDANDLGEAIDYYSPANSTTPVGGSIPTKVVIGPDGKVYYSEIGTTGAFTKGVWQLTDANLNGHCNDPGEATLFWAPPFAASPFYWGLAVDRLGNFYVSDHSNNEQVWRGRDANGDNTIDPSEQSLFYQTGNSTWWDIVLREDGTVLLCEDLNPDRITALRDQNNDGDALDATESTQAYDSTVTSPLVQPRGAALIRAPLLELSPDTVPIGQTTFVTTRTSNPGDLAVAVIAFGLGPNFALPPWGTVEIDLAAFTTVAVGFADSAGSFTVPFAVPSNPNVIGTYAFQSLAGDLFRLFLSNASVLTVTP
jgi:hypothetical protein